MQKFMGIIVGVIFLAVGIFLFVKNANLNKNCTREAQATVVDMEEEYSAGEDDTEYMYYPVIEYQANGETVRVKMDQGSGAPAYEINEKITVLYNPDNVKQFKVKGEKLTGILSFAFMGLGVLVTVGGVVMVLKKGEQPQS